MGKILFGVQGKLPYNSDRVHSKLAGQFFMMNRRVFLRNANMAAVSLAVVGAGVRGGRLAAGVSAGRCCR